MEKQNSYEIEITPVTDFSEWLQREYLKRRKKNANFSIRAFARLLKLEPSTVSQLLSGKRKPSAKFVQKLFSQLEITPKEKDSILSSFRKDNTRESFSKQNYKMIAIDSFKIISEWYHYAIVELTSIKEFRYDNQWISHQLGISVTETRQAIERLIRLELLVEEKGNLVKTNSFVTNYDEGITNSALKNLQRFVLQKALEAIDLVSQDEKDITSMTMAIDETKIPEAKIKIKKFRRELCEFLENGTQTRVFNLGIQLYPLSRETKRKRL